MLYIQNLLHNIAAAHENLRAKLPSKARFGIITLLAVISFIILIFKAEWLMSHMIALLPVFYVAAVLAVGLKRAIYGTILFIFFSFTLWLRVGPSYHSVLGSNFTVFAENDGWYNMRLIENLVHHFPIRNSFDPYTLYPYGQGIPFAPLFDWSAALVIWIAGLGHPSAGLINTIGAYYPTVLGALVIIPVYFIGKELFSRNAGLLAAGLLAILAGEFLARSVLGFTDHHIAETLLSTIAILFFILAIKRAQEARPTLSQIKRREWGSLKKPLLFALLAGFSLGLYILVWIGAALFIFIIFVYLVIQYILDHLNGKSTDYLLIVGITIFLIALLLAAPFHGLLYYSNLDFGALGVGLLAVVVFQIISRIMTRKNIRRIYYPITMVITGLIGIGLFFSIDPSLFNAIIDRFKTLAPSSLSNTVMEAQPLLTGFNISHLMSDRIWVYFTTGVFIAPIAFLVIISATMRREKIGKWLFLSVIGIVLLTVIIDQVTSMPWPIYLVEGVAIIALYTYFEKSPAKTILILWSFVTLIALLSQTRYAYYYAVNLALLSSYILWKIPGWITQILAFLHWKEAPTVSKAKTRAEKKRAKLKEEQPALRHLRPKHASYAISIVIIFFLTIYPNLLYGTYSQNSDSTQPCYQTNAAFCPSCSASLYVASHPFGPDEDWYEAMTWMDANTPYPFGNDSFFYSLYQAPKDGENYNYPASAYGVMSWWDYGHWITTIAHRIPNANPFQAGIGGPGPNGSVTPGASIFMTAQNESSASEVMDELDSKYVVIDYETAWPKYPTMITWSGGNQDDYYDVFWYRESQTSNTVQSMYVWYPRYYQSMCARLYNFGTQAVVASNSTYVLSYTEATFTNGQKFKLIAGSGNGFATDGRPLPFATYEEAEQFIQGHPGYIIVGTNPFVSPIPLEALQQYKLIHSSPTTVIQEGNTSISEVEIFQYTGYKK